MPMIIDGPNEGLTITDGMLTGSQVCVAGSVDESVWCWDEDGGRYGRDFPVHAYELINDEYRYVSSRGGIYDQRST